MVCTQKHKWPQSINSIYPLNIHNFRHFFIVQRRTKIPTYTPRKQLISPNR